METLPNSSSNKILNQVSKEAEIPARNSIYSFNEFSSLNKEINESNQVLFDSKSHKLLLNDECKVKQDNRISLIDNYNENSLLNPNNNKNKTTENNDILFNHNNNEYHNDIDNHQEIKNKNFMNPDLSLEEKSKIRIKKNSINSKIFNTYNYNSIKNENTGNRNSNKLNNTPSFLMQKAEIQTIKDDFYRNKENNEYEFNLLLDNNFVDPSIIYGINYSSFRLDLALTNSLHRIILIGTEEAKIKNFMCCLIKNFDDFFSIEKPQFKNIFLVIRFSQDKEINGLSPIFGDKDKFYNQDDLNSKNISSGSNTQENNNKKYEDSSYSKLYSCTISKNCGIKFIKNILIYEGSDSQIAMKLAHLDESLNLFNIDYELSSSGNINYSSYNNTSNVKDDDFYNSNPIQKNIGGRNNNCSSEDINLNTNFEKRKIKYENCFGEKEEEEHKDDIYISNNENNFNYNGYEYFPNNSNDSHKIKIFQEAVFILEIPYSRIRVHNIDKDNLFDSEFFILPSLKLEDNVNYNILDRRNENYNYKKHKLHPLYIKSYSFLKQFLEYDNLLIQESIENKKTEIKNSINKKLTTKQEWHEDPYFRNNLEKKLHKRNIVINLISLKNIFSENLKFLCNTSEKMEIDKLIYNFYIINDIEDIHPIQIIKLYQSDFFSNLFSSEIESNGNTDGNTSYLECVKIAKFFIEQKIKNENTLRNDIESTYNGISNSTNDKNGFGTNKNFSHSTKIQNADDLHKFYLENYSDGSNISGNIKLVELSQLFILDFMKKLFAKNFSSIDKNQKFHFYSTEYALINFEIFEILRKYEKSQQQGKCFLLSSENLSSKISEIYSDGGERYIFDDNDVNYNSFNKKELNKFFPANTNNQNDATDSEFSETPFSFSSQERNITSIFSNNLNFKNKLDNNNNTQVDNLKNLNKFLHDEIHSNSYFQKIYYNNPDRTIYKTFKEFNKNKLSYMVKRAEAYVKYSKELEKGLNESLTAYSTTEILHFYSNFQRYNTIINDLLSVNADVNYDYIIGNKEDFERIMKLYNDIINSKRLEFEEDIEVFHKEFFEDLEKFYTDNISEIEKYDQSIFLYTKSKLNSMENKFMQLLDDTKIQIDNFLNEISERNIKLILKIISELKNKGYLNDFIANYLINIQNMINLNNFDFDFYYDTIAKDLLIRFGVSSGIGLASGFIGFGLSRILTIITADAVSGSVAGPVGTVAGATVGILTMLGTSYTYFSNNKSEFKKKYLEMKEKTQIFYDLLKDKIQEFYNKNKEEINTRLKKLVCYIEFTIRKYLQLQEKRSFFRHSD